MCVCVCVFLISTAHTNQTQAPCAAVWLEPEGLDTDVVYPNGITDGKSTPLAGQLAHTLLWAGVLNWARTPGGAPRAQPRKGSAVSRATRQAARAVESPSITAPYSK